MKFQLGVRVTDTVTGFTGVITGYTLWLNGCEQFCVKPAIDKDGKMPDGVWIDEGQLELVDSRAIPKRAKSQTGGPQADAPGDTYRGR